MEDIINIPHRGDLERLLHLSHHTENNLVIPLILQYFELTKYYKKEYVLGCMEAHYLSNRKNEKIFYSK